jgi:hypothetical protein
MRYPLWNKKIPIEEKRNVIKIDAVSEVEKGVSPTPRTDCLKPLMR